MRRSVVAAARQSRHALAGSETSSRLTTCGACWPALSSPPLAHWNHLRQTQPSVQCATQRPHSTTRRQFTTTSRRHKGESLSQDSHYEFFPDTLPQGPPPSGRFHIDLRQLRNEFLKLQATAHPDRHPGKLKARAEALSSRINEAYKTLKEPLPRAQYILALNGVDVEDEAGKVEDMDLLALVMEAREEIEDAQNEKELQGLKQENEERLDGTVEKLGRLLERGQWDDARAEAVRLRYWVNVKDSIEAWKPGEGVPNLVH